MNKNHLPPKWLHIDIINMDIKKYNIMLGITEVQSNGWQLIIKQLSKRRLLWQM